MQAGLGAQGVRFEADRGIGGGVVSQDTAVYPTLPTPHN